MSQPEQRDDTSDAAVVQLQPRLSPPAAAVPPPPEPAPIEDDEIAVHAKRRAQHIVLIRQFAGTVVSLTADLAGQDSRHSRGIDVLAAGNIEELLTAVYDAKTVEVPAAFRKRSEDADIERQNAVAKALRGD